MVSIHRPLGYGPSTLPLRHSALQPECVTNNTLNCTSKHASNEKTVRAGSGRGIYFNSLATRCQQFVLMSLPESEKTRNRKVNINTELSYWAQKEERLDN